MAYIVLHILWVLDIVEPVLKPVNLVLNSVITV